MSTRRSVFWAFLGQVVSAVIGFGGSVVIARLLTPYELGLHAAALATSGILSVMASSGADALIVREVKITPDVIARATTVNALLSLVFSIALIAISFFAEPLLGDVRAAANLRLLAILPLIAIITFRPAAMLQRDMRFKAASWVLVISLAVVNATTIGCILGGLGYISPGIGAVAGSLAGLVFYALFSPKELSVRFHFQGIWPTILFGFRMMSVSGVGQFTQHFSQIILARMLGIPALGLYSRAAMLANFLYTNLYGTATRVAFAQLSRSFRETGELRETFLRSFYVIISVMWPLLIGLAVLSKPLIVMLYGDRWIDAANPLSLLFIAQVLTLSFGMNWELFVLRDKLNVQTRYEILRSLCGLGLFALGCLVSMDAAAAGRILDALLGCLLYFRWMGRLSGADNHEILAIYRGSAVLSALAVAPSLCLMIATGWDPYVSRWVLGLAVAMGVISWAITIHVMDHPLRAEMQIVASAARRASAAILFRRILRTAQPENQAIPPAPPPHLPINERF